MRLSEMETPIDVHEYLLKSGGTLNAVSQRREFAGALIRVNGGHGCVHPWPEFGDVPVAEQLRLLSVGETTPVTAMALRCAEIDGEARRAGRSLMDGLQVPKSHYSWNSSADPESQMQRVMDEGWPAIKVKGSADFRETIGFLKGCAERGVRLRVDFNGVLSRDGFESFIQDLPLAVKTVLDFVEDPFPYEAEAWEEVRQLCGVKLALDKGWRDGSRGFDTVVVKPARRNWREVTALHGGMPLVMTSAMDHALGQVFAAYEAAVASASGVALDFGGLCTEHLFAEDAFFERMQSRGGFLDWDPSGGGLGFGEVLEALPWRRLVR